VIVVVVGFSELAPPVTVSADWLDELPA